MIILPSLAIILSIILTRGMKREYSSNTVLYTGVISGYNIESIASPINIAQSDSQIDNFLNIIRSYTTLKNVSMRLYSQHMVHGDTLFDTPYITASHFRPVYGITPPDVKALIDRSSEERTFENIALYNKNEHDNFIYGIFMWDYSYYGKKTLEGMQVTRVGNSDMINIRYTSDDPNVVYHTLLLLNEEFMYQYRILRDQEADRAIAYYEAELRRIDSLLKVAEDEQKRYFIQKKIINYEEQTKQMAAIQSNYKLSLQDALISYNNSKIIIDDLEKRFGKNFEPIKNNVDFINKINQVSDLSNQIAISSIFQNPESLDTIQGVPTSSTNYALQRELKKTENALKKDVDDYFSFTGTGEILISKDIAYEWLQALIAHEKAKKDLEVLKSIEKDINQMFDDYSPVGIYLKQQDRLVGFLEKEYFAILDNLNQARLRKRNTEMSTSNLKVITPPQLPLSAEPTKRVYFVIGAGFGVFIFLLCILILIELLGTTLRDKDRTERLTKGIVFAAMPTPYDRINKKYYDDYVRAAIRHLSNAILNKVKYQEQNIVNIISISPNVGKTTMINQLSAYWNSIGRKHRIINWKEALDKIDRDVMYPINYNDLLSFGIDKILVIEHRDLSSDIIQKEVLQNAILNILVLDATSSWKETQQNNYLTLLGLLGSKSNTLFICLSNAKKSVVEDFTEQLPPYNLFSNLSYDTFNLGKSSTKK